MKRAIVLAIITTFTPLAWGQSKAETTSWLKTFTTAHSIWVNNDGSTTGNTMIVNDCVISVRSTTVMKDGSIEDPGADRAWFQFSLGDIDPNAVKTVVPLGYSAANTEFETTDSRQRVAICNSKSCSYVMTGWQINIDTKENADRFTRAFKHAVILCGGKTSTF